MANYTMTLLDVLNLPGFELFEPLPYLGYDSVKKFICDSFLNLEIAYDTPQLFKIKLNNKLRLNCENYNKMLKSQLIEIDPFITEYMEISNMADDASHGHEHSIGEQTNSGWDNARTFRSEKNSDSFTENASDSHDIGNVSVSLEARLNSRATNRNADEESSQNFEKKQTANEKTSSKRDNSEGIDFHSEESETFDRTQNVEREKDYDESGTDKQLSRNWTEKGNDKSHNLDVHSDTPQAMLFNEPNHYYGTGRAHDAGTVKTDAQGDDYYEHFPESDPAQMDAGHYKVGGGDTPWFNYASDANNRINHSNYDKSGTENYDRANTKKTTENENTDLTENTSKNTNRTDDTDKAFSETASSEKDNTLDETQKTTASKTAKESEALNENTHGRADSKEEETYAGSSSRGSQRDVSRASSSTDNRLSRRHSETESGMKRAGEQHHEETTIRRGRYKRSMSALLNEYRETMTFNADAWLIGELQPLFLDLW